MKRLRLELWPCSARSMATRFGWCRLARHPWNCVVVRMCYVPVISACFVLFSETGVAAGVRRIEAVTGEGAYQLWLAERNQLSEVASLLRTQPAEAVSAVEQLQARLKAAEKEVGSLKGKQSTGMLDELV